VFAFTLNFFPNFVGGVFSRAGISLCRLLAYEHMTCPHCQKEMPENHGAAYCPLCGKGLPPESPPSGEVVLEKKFPWRWFLFALLVPPLSTLISAATMRYVFLPAATNEGVSPMVGLWGGIVGGVACGVILGAFSGKSLAQQILVSLVGMVMMIVVCVMLCFFGCSMGGYQLRFG
jgi:amino acid transporter